MTITLSHLTDLQRVRIGISDLPDITVGVERSTNSLFWQPVRGGVALPIIDGVAQLDDYEFVPDVENHYRLVFPPEYVPIEELDMQQRIATEVQTADSAGFTAETVVMSVTALLEIGRTYRVKFHGRFGGSTGDTLGGLLREDGLAGTEMSGQVDAVQPGVAGGVFGFEAEFTAVSTGNKTFVVTGRRVSGTAGDMRLEAATTRPAYLYVDYIRG